MGSSSAAQHLYSAPQLANMSKKSRASCNNYTSIQQAYYAENPVVNPSVSIQRRQKQERQTPNKKLRLDEGKRLARVHIRRMTKAPRRPQKSTRDKLHYTNVSPPQKRIKFDQNENSKNICPSLHVMWFIVHGCVHFYIASKRLSSTLHLIL